MEFIGLKIVALIVVVSLGVYLYRKYAGVSDPVASLEKLIGTQIEKLETFAKTKEAEVEQHVYDALRIDQLKQDAEAAVERAKHFAGKVKGLFN